MRKYEYIEAPIYPQFDTLREEELFYNDAVFLGGSISKAWNWQHYVGDQLLDSLHVINPRRENFDTADEKVSEIQIDWEYTLLRKPKNLIFWFSHETVAPITLFELGAAMERNNQNLYIGCDKNYVRKFYVVYQASKKGRNVHLDVDSLTDEIIIKNYKKDLQN